MCAPYELIQLERQVQFKMSKLYHAQVIKLKQHHKIEKQIKHLEKILVMYAMSHGLTTVS